MKRFILLSIWLLLFLSTSLSFAQERKLTIRAENVRTAEVLREIEKQSGYTFFYNNEDVNPEKIVSVNVSEKTIEEIVATIIPNVNCEFKGRKILLVKAAANSEKNTVQKKVPANPVAITGMVKDSAGEPVIGAVVQIESASKTYSAVVSVSGQFSITLPDMPGKGTTISVQCIGFKTKSMKMDERKDYLIVMDDDFEMLAETVVVGYGVQKKVNVTGAVSTVSSKELADRPVAQVGAALQGMVPNLNVTTGGRPGESSTFNIRGNTSPNGGEPLILVDGVETNIARINPSDIESISVLRDAASAAIYGARGAFGVILVTTKNGSNERQPVVNVDMRYSFSRNTVSTDFETRGYYQARIADSFFSSKKGVNYTSYTDYDYQRLWERRNDVTENPERPWVLTEMRDGVLSYVYLANFDWYNYMFDESRPTQEYNVSVSGGSKNVNYLVSGRYYHQQGIFRIPAPDSFDSFNANAKINVKIRPWLQLNTKFRYYSGTYSYYTNDNRAAWLHALSCFVPVNPDGTAVSHTSMTNSATHFIMDGMNAMLVKGKQWGIEPKNEVLASAALVADIAKGLKLNLDASYLSYNGRTDSRETNVQYSKYPGVIETESTNTFTDRFTRKSKERGYFSANAFLSYDNSWNEKHHVTATLGANYETTNEINWKISRDDLISEVLSDFNLATGNISSLTGGVSQHAILGAFYRMTYDYKGKYLLETNGRLDGSSRFPVGRQWGFFPSVSGGWRISEEPFFSGLKDVMNNAKIRVSYGSLGNQNISDYQYYQTVSTSGTIKYTFDGQTRAGHAVISDPVSSGTWEKVITKDLGMDLSFFKGKLNLSADTYIRDTKGILAPGRKLPAVYGASEPVINANDLRTNGWEIQVGWKSSFELGGSPVNYQIGFNVADYKAWYTRCDNPSGLIDEPYVGKRLGELWGFTVDGLFTSDAEAADYASRIDLSYPFGQDYSSVGEYGKGVRAGDCRFVDLDGNERIDEGAGTLENPGDMSIIGNSQPRYSYGINTGLTWKGFDLSIFIQGIGHMDCYPGGDNTRFWGAYSRPFTSFISRDFMADVWSESNTGAYFPRGRGYAALSGQLLLPNSRYVQNLAYMRLKNLTFGYSIPEKIVSRIGISSARVYFSGDNLFYFSPFHSKILDPEIMVNGGTGSYGDEYNFAKTFCFGLTVKF